MREQVIITDLTRMRDTRVCVAGYLPNNMCIRPDFRHGSLTENWLRINGAVVVRPFARIELDFQQHKPSAPHTEDWIIDARYRAPAGSLALDERIAFLDTIDDGTVEGIFGATVHRSPGWYIKAGEGRRSLGTIEPDRVWQIFYEPKNAGRWDYRLAFRDKAGIRYELSVTDLAFRYYLDWQRGDDEGCANEVAQQLTMTLKQAERLYFRIGLARGTWHEHPGCCFLQITGIYSFPDYLNGRCFADLDTATATNPPGIDMFDDVPF